MKVVWHDSGREPECAPDPDYPSGIDIRLNPLIDKKCLVSLPYPAKRCGHYQITCEKCGRTLAVTTAGRADDPKSIEVPCKELLN